MLQNIEQQNDVEVKSSEPQEQTEQLEGGEESRYGQSEQNFGENDLANVNDISLERVQNE